MRQANREYRDVTQPPPPSEYDHNKVVQEMSVQLTWFTEQIAVAKDKFRKYLDIN